MDNLISKLFSDKNQFKKVCIDQSVIDSVVFYAKKSYPDEFLAMFDGYVENKVLYITGLLFLPGERSHTSASFNDWLIPPTQKKWGSVHSHPGNDASPSNADLMTFSKHGPFHIIVCEPYSLETMKAYDAYGNSTTFEVGNFKNSNEDLMLEDLEDIKNEIDENTDIKPSFFDLDKDFSGFDDEEKTNKYSHEFDPDLSQSHHSSDNVSMDNPNIIKINGEDINGQSPNLGIIIEFKDGKPIIKQFTHDPLNTNPNENDDE